MSASVKDVSTVTKHLMPNIGGSARTTSKTSFQEIWSNQTGKNSAFGDSNKDYKNVSGGKDKVGPGESLKAKGNDFRGNTPVEEATEKELDVKELEAVMETLGTAAMELMQEIADTFGMSMEELQQLMTEMNMDTMDVLDPEMLSVLLLKAGGAENSFELLTNEELYADFQTLMNTQKEMLTELGDELALAKQFAGDLTADVMDVEMTVDEDAVQTEEVNEVNEVNTVQDGAEEHNVVVKAENAAEEQGGQEKHSDHADGQTGNLVLDTMKADAFKPEVQQTAESQLPWDVDTQNIMRQIMDYMKLHVKADVSNLEMQLHPAHLGTLQVQVASKGGVLTANFITENETVKAALESQMVQLKESLAEQGVKVEAIEVTVQTHEFERNLEQGRGRHQGEPERKNKVRRINLNSTMGMEELEELPEEEQLAAEMMAANGSTVDYTV